MATACWVRIMMASAKPRTSITTPRRPYITPMRLWSTVVIHSPPQSGPPALGGDESQHAQRHQNDDQRGDQRDGLADGDRGPVELSEHQLWPPVETSRPAWPGFSGSGPR